MLRSGYITMSSYEEIRESNIARNKKMLESLGFDSTPVMPPPRAQKKRAAKQFKEPVAGTRSSKRIRVETSSAEPTVEGKVASAPRYVKKDYSTTRLEKSYHPALKHFDNETICKNRSSKVVWDVKRMHQHLEVSSSRRTVATTGCAGYGAVLSCSKAAVISKPSSKSTPGSWVVEVVSEGVGGFSVGVCLAAAPGPYKSMGNRQDSWVLHSSGTLMHNRSSIIIKGCESGYSSGDTIGIHLSGDGSLAFDINGTSVDTKVKVAPGKYVLCCQPYMGGVCRL